MGRLRVQKGDIFSIAKPGSVIATSCTSSGDWRRGFLRYIRNNFRDAYRMFLASTGYNQSGSSFLLANRGYYIGFLFTSYGPSKEHLDSHEMILANTKLALKNFLLKAPKNIIYMNKINEQDFGVPWNKTAEVIEAVLTEFPDKTIIAVEL